MQGQGWTPACELKIGDSVRLADGWLDVVGIAPSDELAMVYNVEVEGDHTYFVGGQAWGWSVWAHNACSGTSGDNSAAAKGRKAHNERDYGPGFEKEVTLPSGKRADAVNVETGEVVELKPNNPKAIQRGKKQVEKYVEELNKEFPHRANKFHGRVETYN